MSSLIPKPRLATTPFALLPTPVYTQSLSPATATQYQQAASLMALSHNVLIRGLNSIYLQAPHVTIEKEKVDFMSYAKCWAEVLHAHHKMEETSLFPNIEDATGEKGLMRGSVEEHAAFEEGIKLYDIYLETTPGSFNGIHLCQIIDTFAPALTHHLATEIETLLSLSRFGSKLPLLDLFNAESAKSPLHLTKTGGVPFFFRNLDTEFEGNLWRDWPGVPSLVWWIGQRTVFAWNERWWRFASCDRDGKLRELEFDGEEDVGENER